MQVRFLTKKAKKNEFVKHAIFVKELNKNIYFYLSNKF